MMSFNGEHLFVYGTLLLPEIMQQVTGRRHFCQPAWLYDYARYRVRGKRYPGIIHQPGQEVQGILYMNVSPAAWQRLDSYEDRFYQRVQVEVTAPDGKLSQAWTYVVPPTQQQRLTRQPWCLQQFRQRYLQGFMQQLTNRRY